MIREKKIIRKKEIDFKIFSLDKKSLLVIISILFILLQILFINYYHTKIDGDSIGYVQLSMNLVNNQSFSFDGVNPTALRTPGYPIFLMPFIAVNMLNTVYYIQAILLLLTAVISYKIYELLFDTKFDEKWSILVFIGVLFFPPFFWYTHFIVSEIVFTFMLLLSIYILIHSVKKKNYYLGFLAGLSSGFTCLVRPTTTFFYPFIFALIVAVLVLKIFLHKKSDKKARISYRMVMLMSLMFVLGFMIIYAPWVIRNFLVFDRIILSTTLLPLSLHCALVNGHCANSWDGGITFLDATPEQEYLASISKTELELYNNYHASNIEKIRINGWRNIKIYIRDCWMLLSEPDLYKPINDLLYKTSLGIHGFIVVGLYIFLFLHWLLIIGVLLGLKKLWHILKTFIKSRFSRLSTVDFFYIFLYLFILYYIFMHGLTYSIPRYFVPLFPLVVIFAINTFSRLLTYLLTFKYSKHKRKHFKKQQ